MGRFDKYVLQQLLSLFGFFSLILVLVFWVNKAVILLDKLLGDGQSVQTFMELTLLSLPTIIEIILPITGFIAAVFVTNRLASESELVVIQATGYSPWRLARPVFVFGIIVALMVSALSHTLVPLAARELTEREAEISRDVASRLLTEGTFVHPATGVTFYVREIPPSGELLDIYLSDNRDPEQRQIFLAERALIVADNGSPVLLMFEGMVQTYAQEGQRLAVTTFDSFAYDVGALLSPPDTLARLLRAIPTTELMLDRPAVQLETGAEALEIVREVNFRISKALFGLFAPLIGFAALLAGGFSRFGLWRQVFLSFGIVIVVKAIENNAIAQANKFPAVWPTLYVSVIVAFGAAAALLWITANPDKLRKKRPPIESPSQ